MVKYKIALGSIILLFIVSGFYSINNLLLYTPDSARYVAWANSLAQFNGFTDTTAPETTRYVVHSPLYPLLLSPIAFFAPNSIVALKILNLFIGAAVMIVLFAIIRKKGNPVIAFLISLLFAFHPLVLILSTQVLTEMLFGLFFVLLLYLLSREEDELHPDKNFYFIVAVVIGSVFSREVGLITILIVTGFFVYRKQYTKAILVFFIPIIFYSGWYLRNEVYYGSLENPELRNSTLFFSNILTSANESYFFELWTRIVKNSQFYASNAVVLIFSSVYDSFQYTFNNPWMALVNQQSMVMKAVSAVMSRIYGVIGIAGVAVVMTGIWAEFKNDKDFYIKVVLFAAHVGIILVYPVIDVRFLFPILLLFLLWFASGIHFFVQLNPHRNQMIAAFVLCLLMVPNIVWSSNFVTTQHTLRQDPLGSFMDAVDASGLPVRHAEIPLPFAAEWLNQQDDSSAVVLSPYKELSFFLNDKKVYVLRGMVPVNLFNASIRDYHIRYIVSAIDNYEWRDYEYDFGLNRDYSFKKVFAEGAFEVYEVFPYSPALKNIGRYAGVLEEMKNGNDSAANNFFINNHSLVSGHPDMTYLALVAKHAIGEFDSVKYLADRLYKKPQGLLNVQQASVHETIIQLRQMLNSYPYTSFQRANLSLLIGTRYWGLDMQKQAIFYTRKSLDDDSTYALSYVYNIVFAFQVHDTAFAYSVQRKMRRVFPEAELTDRIDTLLSAYTEYRSSSSSEEKARYLEKIFDSFNFLGFYDVAIDNGLLSLNFDPNRRSMYFKLGMAYDKKNKHYSSMSILQKEEEIDKGNEKLDSLLNVQRKKLYLH